jgi:hypothetical protein
VHSVIWRSDRLQSSEHCALTESDAGNRLTGVVVIALGVEPGHLSYTVDADARWHTRSVEVVVTTTDSRRLLLVADGSGGWTVDGKAAPELEGCLDVDLGFTPSTNTLPIRRLALGQGTAAEVAAAWVRFPELTPERLDQSYERLAADRWRYRSAGFEAELVVDSSGLVTRYGDDIWTAVARRGEP